MKKLLCIWILSNIFLSGYCQTARQVVNDLSGHFDIVENTAKGQEHVNVNYALLPGSLYKSLIIHLNTPDPRLLYLKLTNEDGFVIAGWQPAQISYQYDASFDLSALISGKYYINIYDAQYRKVHNISFQKE